MFPRPYSLTSGLNPGGTNSTGGRPYPFNLVLMSSRLSAYAGFIAKAAKRPSAAASEARPFLDLFTSNW